MTKNILPRFDKFANKSLMWCDYVLVALTGLALVTLTLLIFIDVFSRYFFNYPIPGGKEISELLMPYISFCALSYTLSKKSHIRMTLLLQFVEKNKKVLEIIECFCCLLGGAFCIVITIWSWKFFLTSFSIREEMLAVVKLPWYVGKLAMPVGYFTFALRYLDELGEHVAEVLKS